ncbi:MAG: hypothetical protein KAH32_01150 [Chlamydiia bacterium]|nr:hypothetical protein [Chlamydiia bacterium]
MYIDLGLVKRSVVVSIISDDLFLLDEYLEVFIRQFPNIDLSQLKKNKINVYKSDATCLESMLYGFFPKESCDNMFIIHCLGCLMSEKRVKFLYDFAKEYGHKIILINESTSRKKIAYSNIYSINFNTLKPWDIVALNKKWAQDRFYDSKKESLSLKNINKVVDNSISRKQIIDAILQIERSESIDFSSKKSINDIVKSKKSTLQDVNEAYSGLNSDYVEYMYKTLYAIANHSKTIDTNKLKFISACSHDNIDRNKRVSLLSSVLNIFC